MADALPDPKYIYHPSDVDGEDDLFLFCETGDVACPKCERLYTADQLREVLVERMRNADRCAEQSKRWHDERAQYVAFECAAAIRKGD